MWGEENLAPKSCLVQCHGTRLWVEGGLRKPVDIEGLPPPMHPNEEEGRQKCPEAWVDEQGVTGKAQNKKETCRGWKQGWIIWEEHR